MIFLLNNETDRQSMIAAIESVEIDPLFPVGIKLMHKRRPAGKRLTAYYRGVILKTLSDYTGYEEDELHEILVHHHLPAATYRS